MSEIDKLEKGLEASLKYLKDEFNMCAVKAEFEAEGSSFRDLARLRRWTAFHGIELYLKIGGVEALRDIKDAFDLGVDGLIAPMVESPFGITKFTDAVNSIFSGRNIYKSINVETQTAVLYIDDILADAKDKVDSITIGRTDLSLSYFDPDIKPDSKFIFDLIETISDKARKAGLALTIGGSISTESINQFRKQREKFKDRISSIETRKIILPVESFLEKERALEEALRFEDLYLRAKLETERLFSQADRNRLAKLKPRI